MKFADLPKQQVSHLTKPSGVSLEDWQTMLRMQQAMREDFEVECVSERYNPGEYNVRSRKSGGMYKVVFRGPKSPWNYCDCMDFKTSQLGTCKHIEATRKWIADHHKRIHWDLPAYTSVYLSYRGTERRVRIRIGSDSAEAFRQLATRYFDDLGDLLPTAYEHFGEFLNEAKVIDDGFRCYKDALDFVIEKRESLRRQRVIDERYGDEALDGLLRTHLYPYQKEGVRFAAAAGRSILADQMGLGKTVQAIATAELLRCEHFVEQVLILCPATLKYQWRSEIERFTDMKAIVVEGNTHRREELLESDAVYKIASYNSITKTDVLYCDMLILDEVQRLKNWNTQLSRAVRKITSRYALVLSGTPLENRLEDLYSIVELVDQFALSPYYLFRDRYMQTDETGRVIAYRNLNEIGDRIKPLLLRRRKSDVELQLPARIDKNLFVPMTPEQADAHAELKTQAARLVAKWHRQHFLSEVDRQYLLRTLSQMRMACDSLYVVDEKSRADTKVEETMNILSECAATDKVVIFSQWERMTRLVAQELDRSGIDYAYIHGNVPAAERQSRIDAFVNEPDVRVFLSTDAGSTGLNLQVASVIINLDLPWNPAVLEQRIGRIHRIGQTRGVEVINLISAGTIEEDMLSKLRFKTLLFDGVLDGGEDALCLSDDKWTSLLESIQDFDDALQPAEQSQTPETEAAPIEDNTLIKALVKDLTALLMADEATRQRAAKLLMEVKI